MKERLYLRKDFRDSIQNQIIASELLQEKRSTDTVTCLTILLKLIIEKHYDLPSRCVGAAAFLQIIRSQFHHL